MENLTKYLEKDAKILITFASNPTELYDAYVLEVTKNTIYISFPKDLPNVYKGSSLNVSILAPAGRIVFDTKVKEVIRESASLGIDKSNNISFEQLRQFYRIPVRFSVKICLGTLETVRKHSDADFIDAIVNDLSGGGFNISTELDINENDIIVADFSDTIPQMPQTEARAVRVALTENKSISFSFINTTEVMTDKIIRYIFRKQMEMRNKI